MKQVCFLLFACTWMLHAIGQSIDSTYTVRLPQKDYGRIARTQKTAGIVLLLTGVSSLVLTTADIAGSNDVDQSDRDWWGLSLHSDPPYGLYYGLGALQATAGILLLHAAKQNKAKASMLALSIQQATPFGHIRNGTVRQSAITLRVPIH